MVMTMLKKKDEYKLKNYFEYNKKNSISITRIVSLVLIGIITINIFSSIKEIKDFLYAAKYINSNYTYKN